MLFSFLFNSVFCPRTIVNYGFLPLMIELVNPKTQAVIPDPQVNAIFLFGSILFFSKIDINSSFFLKYDH